MIYSIKHHSVFTFLIIATLIILCSITSCSGNKQQSDEPFIINLSEGLDKVEEIGLSDFLTNITYIPLETSEACLIGPYFEKIITGEFIVVISQGCYLFDKGSGKFVREIGKVGRGPGEIRAFRFFHQPTGTLYFESAVKNQLLRYSLDGSFLGTINIQVFPPSTLGDITFLNDSLLICYFLNVTGGEKNLAAIFSQSGDLVRTFPNAYTYDQNKQFSVDRKEAGFIESNGKLLLKVWHNDTIFRVEVDSLIPELVLDRGRYRPSFESRYWSQEERKQAMFINITAFINTGRYWLIKLSRGQSTFFGLYDISDRDLKITETTSGFLDGFMGPMKTDFTKTSNSGEICIFLQPNEILEWIENNPEKMKNAPPERQKLLTIRPSDNPVVVIAKIRQ